MATCYRCRKEAGLFGAFNKQTGRCGKCDNEVNQALGSFRMTFINYCSDGLLTNAEWNSLVMIMERERISKQEAMAFVRGDAVNFVERSLLFASADGFVSDAEENAIHYLINGLEIPHNLSQPIINRLAYIKQLGNIRKGNLPIIQPSVRLEMDELCYLEIPATFNKVNAKAIVPVYGRLVATNRKILFLSQTGGTEILLKNIMRVTAQQNGIYLELSVKTGNGFYVVQDPPYTEAVVETIIRISKREILDYKADRDTRKIPQDVKAAVWQRDRGKCVECGEANYLELDHVIPWSKGGASSVNNLQLLCRGCNQKKSDRI
jgi:hypothetical protein